MSRERRIEREFGVPVPGEILPEEQWTRTAALKQLPTEGQLNWRELFGRDAPGAGGKGSGAAIIATGPLFPRHLGREEPRRKERQASPI